MTDTMTFEDFETEAEREEREAVQAGNPPLADSDYEYGYPWDERAEAEENDYLADMGTSYFYDVLHTNPWSNPYVGGEDFS